MNDQSNRTRQIKPMSLGFLADVIRQARLAWRLLLDPRVPLWAKTIVPASLIYLLSPIDLMPDVLLGLGQLDDLAVIILGVKLFIDLCPPEIVREHMQDLMGESNWHVEADSSSAPDSEVIDAPYEIKRE